MSIPALRWARTQMPRRGGNPYPIGKAVLVYLCDRADAQQQCFPGQETISRETGYGVTAIASALVTLEEQGYISRSMRRHQSGARKGERTSDRYTILVSRGADDLERDLAQPSGLAKADRRPRQSAPSAGPTVAVSRNDLIPVVGRQPDGAVLRPRVSRASGKAWPLPTTVEDRWVEYRDDGPGARDARAAVFASRQPGQAPPAWHYQRWAEPSGSDATSAAEPGAMG